jgi:uncharacterized membrane protein YdjX (TVP38/TMEM64 family)
VEAFLFIVSLIPEFDYFATFDEGGLGFLQRKLCTGALQTSEVVQALRLPFLVEDMSFLLSQTKWVARLAGVGLLVVDVVAPATSSIVMVANGMLFGAVWGTLLSVVGGMGAALLGYWMGVRGERAGKRWLGEESLTRANAFFSSYGMMALIVSRPIPIVAEAVSIIAGMSRMPTRKFLPAALLGLLPTAIIYGIAGRYTTDLDHGLYAFLAVRVVAGTVWAVGSLMMRSKNSATRGEV